MVRIKRPYIDMSNPVTKGTGPHSLWKHRFASKMYERLQLLPAEKERPRSDFIWNYDAELYACNHRLNESHLTIDLTRLVFTDISYAQREIEKRSQLLEHVSNFTEIENNSTLAENGSSLLKSQLEKVLKEWYPKLPNAFLNKSVQYYYDLSSNISEWLGFKDLIRASDTNPNVLSRALHAYIGAIDKSAGQKRVQQFINDMYLYHYVDINELFFNNADDDNNALEYLKEYTGKSLEARLLWTSGISTLLAIYVVGIYDEDKRLMGQSPGQSIDEATQMAARDCLRNLFKTHEARALIQQQFEH